MDSYRPLPNGITIKKSRIEGLGLFATEAIKVGTIIGVTHFIVGDELKRTPLGGFYNHSNKPNCTKIRTHRLASYGEQIEYMMVATRDIEPGNEITLNYTFYKISD